MEFLQSVQMEHIVEISIAGDHIVQNTAHTAEISAPNMLFKYDTVRLHH